MYERRNHIVYDLETSSVDPSQGAEIVQIAAKALNSHDFSDHEVGNFHIILKPKHPDKAHPDAIKVIGEDLWQKALEEGIDQKVGLRKFISYINELNFSGQHYNAPILVGFNNVGFDNSFLKYWLLHYKLIATGKNGKPPEWPWCYYTKDVFMQMLDLFSRDNLPNRKLDTFAEMFGMGRTAETHDAMEDVELTAKIYIRYMKMMEIIRTKLVIQNDD